MAADVFTKGFVDIPKWQRACLLINHVDPSTFWTPAVSGTGGVSSPGASSAGTVASPAGTGTACSAVAPKGCTGTAGATQSPSQKNCIGTADTSKGTVVKHKRHMLVVSYKSVPIMHGNVPRARNCDVEMVELRKGPRICDDLASLVVRRNTMVHVELPQTACDIREFNTW
jgi:hypothetical protein